MKNKGFTLVELLGVITILAMFGLIIIPTIDNVITNNKKKLYDVQIRNIKSGASNFVDEHFFDSSLDIPNGGSIGVRLGKLKELGYVDDNIKNPVSKKLFDDDMIILINYNNSSFNYIVCDDGVVCGTPLSIYGE